MRVEFEQAPLNAKPPKEGWDDIDPIDAAKGAAILVGFVFLKGALRGGYENSREQVGRINDQISDDATRLERAKTVLTEFGYRKALVAAGSAGRDEVENTLRFLFGKPRKEKSAPQAPKVDIMPGNGITNQTFHPQWGGVFTSKAA